MNSSPRSTSSRGLRNLVTFGGKFPTLRATGAEDLEAEAKEICCQAEDDAKKLARRSQRQSAEDRARGPVQPAQPASSSAARSRRLGQSGLEQSGPEQLAVVDLEFARLVY